MQNKQYELTGTVTLPLTMVVKDCKSKEQAKQYATEMLLAADGGITDAATMASFLGFGGLELGEKPINEKAVKFHDAKETELVTSSKECNNCARYRAGKTVCDNDWMQKNVCDDYLKASPRMCVCYCSRCSREVGLGDSNESYTCEECRENLEPVTSPYSLFENYD